MNSEEKMIMDIHSAFLLEYTQAASSLNEFYETVISFFTRICPEENKENKERLEENVQSIRDICFFLKTFCAEAKLHTKLLKSKHKDESTNKCEQVEDVNLEYELPENPNAIYPFEMYPDIFTYNIVDPSKCMAYNKKHAPPTCRKKKVQLRRARLTRLTECELKIFIDSIGHEEEFLISYIKDDISFLFFILSLSNPKIVISQPDFRFGVIPAQGQVFGLLLDGNIVRAVRENDLPNQPTFKVFLIDFGEILEITQGFKMYQLPEEMQQIPGQAIFCKLSENENADMSNDSLHNKLHTKQKIRIDRVYKNMLEVSFLASFTSSTLTKDLNPKTVSNRPKSKTEATKPTQLPNNVSAKAHSNPVRKQQNRNNSLTQEELDELFEEVPTTENALQAVMGYIPQDDKRICKFYDSKTGACFKGNNCTLEHTTILKDGWTKDQIPIKLKVHSEIPMPRIGKKVNLFVSYVLDVDRFYAQIIHQNCKKTSDLTADIIFSKIEKKASSLKKIVQPPGECELVFAKFKEEWYRAKVLHKLSAVNYRVFYVDYGNCGLVDLEDMRQWDSEFDCYPFQALECKLDNIKKLKNRDDKAIAYFERLVLLQSVTATVTSNVGILLVTLQDNQNFDIGDQLCAANFAMSKPITRFGGGSYPG